MMIITALLFAISISKRENFVSVKKDKTTFEAQMEILKGSQLAALGKEPSGKYKPSLEMEWEASKGKALLDMHSHPTSDPLSKLGKWVRTKYTIMKSNSRAAKPIGRK